MSDYQPHSPQDFGTEDAFNAEMTPTGPAPMSGMAVTGFVSSVIVCCPVLSPLLGLIFSVVGLVQTRDGRRRGRGLAIAGLVISLVASTPFSAWLIAAVMNFATGQLSIMQALQELNDGEVDAGMARIHKAGSEEFKAEVSEEQLTRWLSEQCQARGGIQGVTVSPQNQPTAVGNNRMSWGFPVQFPEGPATLSIEFSFDKLGRWIVQNVLLDEASIRKVVDAQPAVKPTADATGNQDAAQPEDTD